MTAPRSICGVDLEDLAEWSEPQLVHGVLQRFARPSRLYQVLAARVPDRLRRAGIALRWSGSGALRQALLVQTLDAPPPVRAVVEREGTALAAAPDESVDVAGLLPWQPAAVRALKHFWHRGRRAFLDASDTGVGKTYVGLAFARELRREVYCVTRKPAIPQWQEAAAALGVRCAVTNYEALKTGKHPWCAWRPHRSGTSWPEWRLSRRRALLLFDEAQWCGSPEHSLNSKLLLTAAWQQLPLHLMSATLATTPLRLRAAGYALGLHDNADWPAWLEAHGCFQSGSEWLFNNSREVMRGLHRQIFTCCGIRIRKEDCPGFPECLVEAVLADYPPAVGRALAPVAAMLERVRTRTAGYADGAFPQVLAARQHAEAAKVATVVAQAREDMAEGKAVALFWNFDEAARTAAELLGCPLIVGHQKPAEREAIRRAFCADQIPAISCNNESGGVALSLHGRKPRRGHVMPTWKADTLRQVLGRLPRAGGAYTHYTIWHAAGTVEEDICRSVRTKLRNLDTLNDGDTQGLFALVRLAPVNPKRGYN